MEAEESKPHSLLRKYEGKYQRFAARTFSRRPFKVAPQTPIISFTFDDFPRSALLTGGAILKSVAAVGTYYASFGLMGQTDSTGEIFLPEDIKLLLQQGHELGCHTYGHCHAWDTSPRDFEEAILQNRAALHKLAPEANFRTLSYPKSVPRAETKRRAAKYFDCCRCGSQKFNIGTVDLNYLSAFFLEQCRGNPSVIRELIDENQRACGWLIFATHDVCDRPTRWGCTPEFFEDIVRYSAGSGARILPVIEAFETLKSASTK